MKKKLSNQSTLNSNGIINARTEHSALPKLKAKVKFVHFVLALTVLFSLSVNKSNAQIIYNESFDGTTFVPTGWTYLSGNPSWLRVTAGTYPVQSPHSGPGEARFNSFSVSSGNAAMVTPPFSLVNNTTGSPVTFWMYRDAGYATTADKLDVYYNTSNSLTGATLLGTVNRANGLTPTAVTPNAWNSYTFTIPNTVTSASVYVIFQGTSLYGNDIYLDDVSWEAFPPPCQGTPTTNSIFPISYTSCPGLGNPMLGLTNTYSVGGISYQWSTSTVSAVGPFAPVSGATLASAPVPTLGVTTWYQTVITCTNTGLSITLPSSQIYIGGVTTNAVPYYEGFEGLQSNNRLPNCSWSAANIGSSVTTYTASQSSNRVPNTGNGFASFGLPSNNNAVYTNAIQMEPGVTYSAALWYTTDYIGNSNWTNLSILVGPNQSTTGLVQVASVSPAISGPYKLLSGTYSVPTSGLYYVAIMATSPSGSALYLSWDDLSVTIPCYGPGASNSPTVTLSTNTPTICSGTPVTLSSTGADTFTWSTGSNANSITETPNLDLLYTVWGTNTLTGCTNTVTQFVKVNASPAVFVVASNPSVCAGEPVNITAFGADSYAWSGNNPANPIITVSPTVTTTYNVVGTNNNGCTGTNSQQITVKPLPNVNATSSNPIDACKNDVIVLTAGGSATTYQWLGSTGIVLQGSSININLTSQTTFTVIGTDANGCVNKTFFTQNVNACTGINTYASELKGLKVYPNPTGGEFTVELNSGSVKTIEVIDLTGRVVLTNTSANEKVNVNINALAKGVYYVKVTSDSAIEVIKVVKQ